MDDLREFKMFAKNLADLSGKVIKGQFRTKLIIEYKEDNSPVTAVDKNTESIMRNTIMKSYPNHGIIGEEFPIHNENAEYKWIIDPIDGTKSYICGAVTFGTLIALTKNGIPILGIINLPLLNEFLIGDNETASLNGMRIKVRNTTEVSKSVLLTTDYLNIKKYQDIDKFNNLISNAKMFRNWGDCYGYYLVATGFADIMIDPVMSLWDKMALIPIINGAGGVITDYHGNDPLKGDSIIASCSEVLHKEVIKSLN
jgi:myo-inositol-1(or 4)-monophosphatase